MTNTYSLLRESLQRNPPRPLSIALAHCMAAAKLGTPRMILLGKLYTLQGWAERAATQAELTRCKQAKRGQIHAVVA